jgi:hypothetical protein
MAGVRQQSPLEAFELNINDGLWLLETAGALRDKRVRRLRAEIREKLGDVLRVPVKDRGRLDAIESDDLFIVIKPSASVGRGHVQDLDPLYRQAIVIAAAAVETYVADAVCRRIGKVLYDGSALPKHLKDLNITVDDWHNIENNYQRRRRGLVEVCLRPRIAELSSADPDPMGKLLSMVRLDGWAGKVDAQRKVAKGTTHRQLKDLATRRNAIAHSGDRKGRGRAAIDLGTAQTHIENARSIVEALDLLLGPAGSE